MQRTALLLLLYSRAVAWFHEGGHDRLEFPERPWYARKREPSFADILSTLRRVSLEEETAQLPVEQPEQKTLFARLVQLLSRTG